MEIELYGNSRPGEEGNAYRHMLVEAKLLEMGGEDFRKEIIELKRSGTKTEPAFCKVLEVEGDPYLKMLDGKFMTGAMKKRLKKRED